MRGSARFDGRERAALIGVLTVMTMASFEDMAVLAVLPTASRDLGAIGGIGLALTGAVIARVLGLVLAGQYSDNHGPGAVLVVGLVLFAIAQLVCGLAPNMPVLVAGRVAHGLAGGLLFTSVYVLIGQIFPVASVPIVLSRTGLAIVAPALFGPLIAGLLTQHVGWRWVFLALVPGSVLAIALMLPVVRRLPRPSMATSRRNNLPFAVAIVMAVTVLEAIGQHPPGWPVLAVATILAGCLLAWGLRAVLPPGAFRVRRGVAAAVSMRGIYNSAFIGVEALIPLSLTLQHGYGPTAAALPLAAAGLAEASGRSIAGRVLRRDDDSHRIALVRAGFALAIIGALVAAVLALPPVPGWLMYPGWSMAALGFGLAFTIFHLLVIRQTTDANRGFDSAAAQLSSATAQAVTIGLGGVLIAIAARGGLSFSTAFLTVNLTMVGILLIGLTLTGRLRLVQGAQLAESDQPAT